jgi:hypothetical protein
MNISNKIGIIEYNGQIMLKPACNDVKVTIILIVGLGKAGIVRCTIKTEAGMDCQGLGRSARRIFKWLDYGEDVIKKIE